MRRSATRTIDTGHELALKDLVQHAQSKGQTFWTRDRLKKLITLFDRDRDGCIDRDEFEEAAQQLTLLATSLQGTYMDMEASGGSPRAASKRNRRVSTAALPQKLKEFKPLAEDESIKACLSPLKPLDEKLVKAASSNPPRPHDVAAAAAELRDQIDVAKPVLAQMIASRVAEPNIALDCLAVVAGGLDFFVGAYNEIFSTIEKSDGLEQYREPTRKLQVAAIDGSAQHRDWLRETHGAAADAWQRTSRIDELMADSLSPAVVAGYDGVLKQLQAAVPNACGPNGGPLKAGPVKHSSRTIEKAMLREEQSAGSADRVCDVRRALLEVKSMAACGDVLEALLRLHENGTLVIVRVKDRIAQPAAGWRDVLCNFYLSADPQRHVCEVQVAHTKMLTARVGLDGHKVYHRVRNAVELLEYMQVGEGQDLWEIATFVDKYGLSRPEGRHWDLTKKSLDDANIQAMCALWLNAATVFRHSTHDLLAAGVGSDDVIVLDLHANQIGDAGVIALAETCANCKKLPKLKELDLSDNEVGDAACASLASALSKGALPSVHKLSLGCNEIGDAGLASLAAAAAGGAIALAGRLELGLDDNNIGDDGMRALASAVAAGAFANMAKLSLDDNDITSEGLRALAEAAVPLAPAEGGGDASPRLSGLEYLDVDGNHGLDEGAYAAIGAALEAGALPSLRILEVDDDMITLPALAEACARRQISLW